MKPSKSPKFIHHPHLIWVEVVVGFILLVFLLSAVRGLELSREPELTKVPAPRENLPPLPEPEIPIVTEGIEGEIIITEEVNTAGWPVYSSENYNFTFRYPAETWFVEEFADYTVLVPPGDIGRIEINTVNVGRDSELDRQGLSEPEEGFLTEDVFSERSAIQYRCVGCVSNRYARHIRITDLRGTDWGASNEIWYDFSLNANVPLTDALSAVALFDRILSTFTIENKASEATWSRYKNADWGFSIAHPPTWGFREAVIGAGADHIVAFGPNVPQLGDGLRIYQRGTADVVSGVRRTCGDFVFDLVREAGTAEVDIMIESFRCD